MSEYPQKLQEAVENPSTPPVPEPTAAEKKAAEAKRLSIQQRLEQERKEDMEAVMILHDRMTASLKTASESLAAASFASEELQRLLGRKRIYRELSMDRRLRVAETVRTVNAARQHVAKVWTGSGMVGKAVKESVDELVRPDSGSVFE